MKKDLNYIIDLAASYMNKFLLLLMGFAVLMFVWNVVMYFIRPSEGDRAEGSKYIMWSLIGFFVILSMWGLVNVLTGTFNLDNKPASWGQYFNIFPK